MFKTVLEPMSAQTEAKKSKFICKIFPARTVAEAEEAVESVRKEHFKATHNVYVYIVGDAYKFSDDGEPSGTSAAPIFEMFRNEGYDYVCAVVTRYFGGTLLGKGGLKRAYLGAAKAALAAGRTVSVSDFGHMKLRLDYTYLGAVERYIAAEGIELAASVYEEKAELELYFDRALREKITSDLVNMTNGRAELEQLPDRLLTEDYEDFNIPPGI